MRRDIMEYQGEFLRCMPRCNTFFGAMYSTSRRAFQHSPVTYFIIPSSSWTSLLWWTPSTKYYGMTGCFMRRDIMEYQGEIFRCMPRCNTFFGAMYSTSRRAFQTACVPCGVFYIAHCSNLTSNPARLLGCSRSNLLVPTTRYLTPRFLTRVRGHFLRDHITSTSIFPQQR